MNYYEVEYNAKSNPCEKRIIQLADEILTLYIANKKNKSLEKTNEFIKEYIKLLEMHKNLSYEFRELKTGLKSQDPPGDKTIHRIESLLVARRLDKYNAGGAIIDDFGYLHNVLFVSWSLEILGIEKREVIREMIKAEFKSPLIFDTVDTSKLDARRRAFIRNAKRAELYSHYPYKDMYTPLILSRMAIEQCIKLMYEKYLGKIPKDDKGYEKPAADCAHDLKEKKIITSAFSTEIKAVRQRGNANTHQGASDYPFAVIHGLQVIKKCYNDLIK